MKNIKLNLTFCILTVSGLAFSQSGFTNRRSVADSLISEGDIPGAITEFRKIYSKDPGNRRNVYNLACALSINRQPDSCFKYLNISVRLDTSISAFTDPDLLPLRNDKQWLDFENKLISMMNIKYRNPFKDIEYAKALWKLMAMDQSYINEIFIAGRKIGMKSSVVEALFRSKSMLNEMAIKELEKLISEKGWPRNSDVGPAAAGAAFYVIQHSDAARQQKYLPMLKQRCEEKEANWQHYAMMYDRMKVLHNLPQKYGTQPVLNNEKTGTFELAPLEDESKVNEWRKEVGLPPLEKYINQINIKDQPKKNP